MYLLFDIGGTKTRIACSQDGKQFGEPIAFESPQQFDVGVAKIVDSAQSLAQGEDFLNIVGGITGIRDREKRQLVYSASLPKWVSQPLAERLEQELDAPVTLENDTAVVGLGEAVAGAGRGHEIVMYVTVSTGVNGVQIVGGQIPPYRHGFEIGKQIIDMNGGKRSTFEQLTGGGFLQQETGQHPSTITDTAVWQQRAERVAIGIINSILHWSPDIVVLGGAMMVKSPGISVEVVAKDAAKYLTILPEVPPIVQATLEDFGGLHGALALARQ